MERLKLEPEGWFGIAHGEWLNPRHTAHLPYEMAIIDNKVFALHPRFRIAIGFPDLKMVGDHGFMKLMKTPEAIEKALTLAAGGAWTRPPPRNFMDQ